MSWRTSTHMRMGRVALVAPPTKEAITTSSKEWMKAKKAETTIAGRTMGRVTSKNARVRLAPRLMAAFSRRMSKPFRAAATITTTTGMEPTV